MSNKTKHLAKQGMIAAIYVVCSLLFVPLSFGAIQFRFAEASLVLLAQDRKNAIGILLGTMITNIFSPLGIVDVIFGTVASGLVVLLFCVKPKLSLLPIFAGLCNGVIIGLQLHYILALPFFYSMLTVFLGEFVVVLIAVIVYKVIKRKKEN